MADLLSNRTTIIYGQTINIERGVPQGDPLSPLLFILQLQPLSDALEESGVGGVTLPGELFVRDLLYADDIFLLSEKPEELNEMLKLCTDWATDNGMEFSIAKSEVMVLTGSDPPEMPVIYLYDTPLQWVREFKYLGFPIFANNKYHKYLPLDLSSVYKVVYPMADIINCGSKIGLPVIQRAQAFITMVEGKAMHNAQVADLDVKSINSYMNRGLKRITGLSDSILLRGDLGVLPAELVIHRNAFYYLWHLRRRTWFRSYLPALAELQPLRRLTSMLLQYPTLRCDMLDKMDYEDWRKIVRLSVIEKAESFYDVASRPEYRLFPNLEYAFSYRGQFYMNHRDTTDLAQIALELRQDRLPVPKNCQPWEYHPCPVCQQPRGLCGSHLLQCQQLPANLQTERSALIDEYHPGLSTEAFARGTLECFGAHIFATGDPATSFLCKSLTLGRKIARFARSQLAQSILDASDQQSESSDSISSDDLSSSQDSLENAPARRLIGATTPGGLSFMAEQIRGG